MFRCAAHACNRDLAARASNHRRIRLLSAARRRRKSEVRSEQLESEKSEEASMGVVMIKCPDTGRDISTGLVADRDSFRATPVFFGRVFCPLCRTNHEWFAQQAWVCEAEPAAVRESE